MRGNVLIIGLGLIGGSVALAIKKEHPQAILFGYDVNETELQLAKMLKVIDEEAIDISSVAPVADLIVVATPVQSTEQILTLLSQCSLKKSVIITDVGSTKQSIMDSANRLFGDRHTFIGGHPMAGSHKSGVRAAKVHLFENALYIFTKSHYVQEREIAILKKWLKGTKAQFLVIAPTEHDYVTGVVSHFPHIVAASLVRQADTARQGQDLVKRMAAGGFRDITRIASSSPEMWRDILLDNDKVMLELMENWINEMTMIKNLIQAKDVDKIESFFQTAKVYRDNLPADTKGALPSFYDLYVDVPDYPGVVSEITAYLAKEEISITNIRILETREEIYGVLVISFQTDEDRERADRCIRSNGHFETYID